MEHATARVETRTTCPYCGVGCGVIATSGPDGSVSVRGDPDHPANAGRLCAKGSALGETLGPEGRLLHPQIGGRRAGWDEALDLVADRFASAIARHGADSVAIYGSGQMLTEDYYVANKLMKGFVGSANIDTNSRLCMASSVAGHRRAFGSDTVPGTYEDLEEADLLLLVGSNLAWCHPVLFQRVMAARAARPDMRIVTIDPRRTATSASADVHLSIAPDGDTALFNLVLAHLDASGAIDRAYVASHVDGFDAALETARRTDPSSTGLPAGEIADFLALFAGTRKVVTVYSQGVNQSASGTDKVNAIINCHLATGRIGRPGMGPFSVTGQPNAMGGREVGGMANMLAAHMDLADPAHRVIVGEFWNTDRLPAEPGLKAVELFEAVRNGQIKALWIIGTNPLVSMPQAGRVREAIEACPFVVVSDVVRSDTALCADVLLPALGWGEKDGTVTNSERRISRQRAFLAPPGEAKADWWALAEVARRLGHAAAFGFDGPAAIFAEHAALSAHRNDGTRDFDLGGLAGMTPDAYEAMAPVRWPVPSSSTGRRDRFFAEGRFYTPNVRARMVAVQPPAPHTAPFVLNTGRVRDQWHTMTRTGRSPRLSAHIAEPFCEIAPSDAARLGLGPADLVRVETAHGSAILRALVTDRQSPGRLFAPMHWSEAFAPAGRIGPLAQGIVDPDSGQPALKSTPATLLRYPAAWYGFAVTRDRPDPTIADYAALARTDGGWRIELAGETPVDGAALAATLFAGDALSHADERTGCRSFAAFADGMLQGALWIAPNPVGVSRSFAAGLLRESALEPSARNAILAGRPGQGRPDGGALVCACASVGRLDVDRAIAAGANDLAAIGAATQAGMNCGACRPELKGILEWASRTNASTDLPRVDA